ncbi:hypothetical protein [Neobacillus niacini]|uniref:hypothetical protein n=1 Tax=Neobacillus niacini TaxID=86668 RepID=UPI00286A3062|nr:hypothetical protein [Neobacillus niacini]
MKDKTHAEWVRLVLHTTDEGQNSCRVGKISPSYRDGYTPKIKKLPQNETAAFIDSDPESVLLPLTLYWS